MTPLVLAIDQGSSSTKVQLVAEDGRVVARAAVAVSEARPRPGWVEQDADEIWSSVTSACAAALDGVEGAEVVAVGLTNQRESVVVWERSTGRPLAPLVSWQDQRTVELHRRGERAGMADVVRRISGLPLDPMFSALKARWLLDAVDPDRARARRGELCIGTVDAWLLHGLTGDHVVEVGNASRTQLVDVTTGQWSPALLDLFEVPEAALPRIVRSDGPFGPVRDLPGVATGAVVAGVLGDSHASLFGHGVRSPGPVKATYGTGSSVMALADPALLRPTGPMCRTIAWQRAGDRAPRTALEGNIRAAGATLVWLARLLGSTPADLARLAAGASSEGVHLVPGFNGLGAPWWDASAMGVVSGLSLSSGAPQLARAAIESIAFQVADLVREVGAAGIPVTELLADGGGSVDDVLMQLQADLTGRPVRRAVRQDVSGLGVAHLAGLARGLWDEDTLAGRREHGDTFEPAIDPVERRTRTVAWLDAVDRARGRSRSGPSGIATDHHDHRHEETP